MQESLHRKYSFGSACSPINYWANFQSILAFTSWPIDEWLFPYPRDWSRISLCKGYGWLETSISFSFYANALANISEFNAPSSCRYVLSLNQGARRVDCLLPVKPGLHYRHFLARLGWNWKGSQKKKFGSDKICSVNNLSVPNFIRAEPKMM